MPNITKSEAPKADLWNKPANPETLRGLLSSTSALERIGKVIPKHLTPDRMLNVSLSIINAPSKGSMRLLDCTPMSLLQSIINLAEVGLEPGSALQHAYLIPYRDTKANRILAKAMIGYQGYIELAMRSGKIAKVEARIAHEKDKLTLVYGFEERFDLIPYVKGDPGPGIAAISFAKFRDGGNHIDHMSAEEIYKIRDRSESYKGAMKYKNSNTPWITDEYEMWKKTVIRKARKYWPQSPELARAAEIDDQDEASEPVLSVSSRPFEVVSDREEIPPPPAPELEDADVEPSGTEEEKMAAPEGDDPMSTLLRGILAAKDRDALDDRIAEAGRERKNMNDEEWASAQKAIAQRKAELQ